MRRIGSDAAGWLSAGRPRREAFRVALRACSRRGAAELVGALADATGALALHARSLRDALAADYTYLQAAQPTTAGHLLLAYAYPALRDAERLQRAHRELSRSVAGAGGSAGSRWPLDRARLAELLGCDGLVAHTKDAAWQWDVYAELLATLAIAATHLSQLAQDFEIYASHEFGLIELADRHSRASALMPQKRNPVRAGGDPRAGGPGRGRRRGRADGRRTRARRAPTTSTCSTGSCRARSRRRARSRGSRPPCSRACASTPSAWRAWRARASRTPPTSPTCSPPTAAWTTARRTRSSAWRSGGSWSRAPASSPPRPSPRPRSSSPAQPVDVDPAQLDPAACAQARLQTGSSSSAAMDAMLAEVDAQSARRPRLVARRPGRRRGRRGAPARARRCARAG